MPSKLAFVLEKRLVFVRELSANTFALNRGKEYLFFLENPTNIMEKTLVILKPDCRKQRVGKVISRFEERI